MDTNMVKPGVRRSACDQCRARRVQCLRAQTSTAPCARCSHTGARCVTSAPGHPGRPRKRRLVDGDTPPRGPAPSPADVSSPGQRRTSSTLRDTNSVEVHALAMPVGFWATPGDSSVSFSSPSTEPSPATGEDNLALVDQLGSPSQLQGLLSADDELSAMLHMDVDPLLAYTWQGVLPPTPLPPPCPSPAISLVRFREELDQRIVAMDTYYSDPLGVVQDCKEEAAGREPRENPVAVLLTSTKEFIDIIQSLTSAGPTYKPNEDALSTEIVLLALSGYLSLMRLYDAMFHTVHTIISQMSPDSFKSVKVKSVLRIGGVSSLQDLPIKTYAAGIVDAIKGQVRTLERCMGIPTECCLSGEEATSPHTTAPGMLSRGDRAQLFWTVLAQEDVKSRREGKSYVESIRASIQESMRFLDD